MPDSVPEGRLKPPARPERREPDEEQPAGEVERRLDQPAGTRPPGACDVIPPSRAIAISRAVARTEHYFCLA